MNDKLKPCPFCGGVARVNRSDVIKNSPSFSVYCTECWCRTFGLFDEEKQAIEAWNRRVNDERK